jgi:3-hydroxyacyl-CoA dehydrogenase
MELSEIYARLNKTELAALRGYQVRLKDRDRDKRTRALRDYRKFIGYLERSGRITEEQRQMLEYYRIEDRHAEAQAPHAPQ